jgi:hypothetical protein
MNRTFLRNLRMPFAMALVSLCVGACARNALDDTYEGSLQLSRQIRDQQTEAFRRWRAEDERWNRGELGPGAARPMMPKRTYDPEMNVIRMQFMERELIAFLGTKCAGQDSGCVLEELKKLGFSCTDAAPASCSLLNIARGKDDAPHKNIREQHAWTVTVAKESATPQIQAHVEIVPGWR